MAKHLAEHTAVKAAPLDATSVRQSKKPVSGLTKLTNYMRRHPFGTVLLFLIGLVIVYVLVRAGARTDDLPSVEFVSEDAQSRIETPALEPGYGSNEPFVLTDVEVVSRTRLSTAPEGAELDVTFAASAYANADVITYYKNDGVRATKTVSLGYARQEEGWISAGPELDSRIAYSATIGVQEDKVLGSCTSILERIDQGRQGDGADEEDFISLAELYTDAEIELVSHDFDESAQSDTVVLSLIKRDGFASWECTMTTKFSFHAVNGTWELTDAFVSPGAELRSWRPLSGTWRGSFTSQATTGTKCVGATNQELVLVIDAIDMGDGRDELTATLRCLAHFHQHPEKDEKSDEGDVFLEDVPITLVYQGTKHGLISGAAVFAATLPDQAGGSVTFAVTFGGNDDPEAVYCVVLSEHTYKDTVLIVPVDKTATWNDSYTLTQDAE